MFTKSLLTPQKCQSWIINDWMLRKVYWRKVFRKKALLHYVLKFSFKIYLLNRNNWTNITYSIFYILYYRNILIENVPTFSTTEVQTEISLHFSFFCFLKTRWLGWLPAHRARPAEGELRCRFSQNMQPYRWQMQKG